MQKWEYLLVIIEINDNTIFQVSANGKNIFDRYDERGSVKKQPAFGLNQYLQTTGYDGWELISVMPVINAGYTKGIHFYFKRPLL